MRNSYLASRNYRLHPYFANFEREHKLLPASDDNPDSTTRKRLVGFRKLYQDIAAKLKTAHERDKRVYDLRRRPVQYLVGQQVWRKDKSLSDAIANYSAKLRPKYRDQTQMWILDLRFGG
ncbi:hypothetical protein MTP99_006717 [Tenebrio molitor]|jgi:hypothetical protein|nr:hypothetical protein MTP99_006717 [Tenebrio molitor]